MKYDIWDFHDGQPVTMKSTVFWDLAPSRWAEVHQRLGSNVGDLLPDNSENSFNATYNSNIGITRLNYWTGTGLSK
jgi:hypothetical protein